MEATSSSNSDASAGAGFSATLRQLFRICRHNINHIFLFINNTGSRFLKQFYSLCGGTRLPPAPSSNIDYTDSNQILMDKSESNHPSEILEKIENDEEKKYDLIYEYLQLKNNNTSIGTEVNIMLEEKLKLETLCNNNIEQIPVYILKIAELNKNIKELTSKNTELEMTMANYMSKHKEIAQQLNNVYTENNDLKLNINKLKMQIKDFEDEKIKDEDEDMYESNNEKETKHLEEISKHIKKIDELREKFRIKVKELRLSEATVISKDLQIISLRAKMAEIEKLKVTE